MRLMRLFLLGAALGAPPALAVGNDPKPPSSSPAKEAAEGFRIIHSDELAALLADKAHPIHLYDANHDEFRQEEGVIAGAVLLSSPHDYDTAKLLPQSKQEPLVFYCSNRL